MTIDPRTLERRAIVDDIVLAFEENPGFLDKSFWKHTDKQAQANPEEPSFFYSFIIRLSPSKLESYLTQNPGVILLARHDQSACLKYIVDTLSPNTFIVLFNKAQCSWREIIRLIVALYQKELDEHRPYLIENLNLFDLLNADDFIELIKKIGPSRAQAFLGDIGASALKRRLSNLTDSQWGELITLEGIDDARLAALMTRTQSLPDDPKRRTSLYMNAYSAEKFETAAVISTIFMSKRRKISNVILPRMTSFEEDLHFIPFIFNLIAKHPKREREILHCKHTASGSNVLQALLSACFNIRALDRLSADDINYLLKLTEKYYRSAKIKERRICSVFFNLIQKGNAETVNTLMPLITNNLSKLLEKDYWLKRDFREIGRIPTENLKALIAHLKPQDIQCLIGIGGRRILKTLRDAVLKAHRETHTNLPLLFGMMAAKQNIPIFILQPQGDENDSLLAAACRPAVFSVLAQYSGLFQLSPEEFMIVLTQKTTGQEEPILLGRAKRGDLEHFNALALRIPENERVSHLLDEAQQYRVSPVTAMLLYSPPDINETLKTLASLTQLTQDEVLAHCDQNLRQTQQYGGSLIRAITVKAPSMEGKNLDGLRLSNNMIEDIPKILSSTSSLFPFHYLDWLLSQRPVYDRARQQEAYNDKLKTSLTSLLRSNAQDIACFFRHCFPGESNSSYGILEALEKHFDSLTQHSMKEAYRGNRHQIREMLVALMPNQMINYPNICKLIYTLGLEANLDVQRLCPLMYLRIHAESKPTPGVLPPAP